MKGRKHSCYRGLLKTIPLLVVFSLVISFLLAVSGPPVFANLELITKELQGPMGVSVTPDGDFLVADYVGNAVIRVSPKGDLASEVKGIPYPMSSIKDQYGRLYTTRDGWGAMLCMSPGSEDYTYLRRNLAGVMRTGGVRTAVGDEYFDLQEGIIASRSGGLRFLPDGNILMALRGKASGAAVFDPHGRILFNHPLLRPNRLILGADIVDLDLSPAGNLVFSDRLRKVILILRKDEARPVVLASEGLTEPWGLAFDPDGNLYITDRAAGKLFRIKSGGGPLELLAGELNQPVGVVWNRKDGYLYFTTYGDGSLWRYVESDEKWGAR